MKTIDDIEMDIKQIIQARKTIKKYETNEMRCNNFELAEKMISESTRDEIDFTNRLIADINECINYPIETFAFFTRQKQAQLKGDVCHKKVIDIPFIDKKEYYCVINFLEKCEYTNDTFDGYWVIHNERRTYL